VKDIEHSGIVRPYRPGAYDSPGNNILNLKGRTKEMVKELGEERAKALMPYQTSTALSKPTLRQILTTIWPKAPDEEVFKAVAICHQYGLNPLMKHIFLVPFKDNWVTIMSIKATRTLASRNGNYSYVDDTPRVMTEEEQKKAFGEVYEKMVAVITVIKDKDGETARGYGFWPKDQVPYGTDKGNTKFNMAAIRSERQALERKFPDALPQGIEVVDEDYMPASNDSKVVIPEDLAEELWNTEGSPPPVPSDGDIDMDWLKESLNKIRWAPFTAKSWLARFGIDTAGNLTDVVSRLTYEQKQQFTEEINRRVEEKERHPAMF